ncbi:1-phosphofructokinase family hexose kinase [Aggregatilinea lenta]|uniref:1-phosphofructokinase family hexose kinase n=1 Tax=Aggregatilinea lenta TaxID=913108 RepID=UPI000E5A5AF5|nr:PfkB family carbohydrate kinase [Aggregatilinea lenta]
MSDTQPAPQPDYPRKVITVTLNPSLDRTIVTHFLALGYQNRVIETTRLDPAGRAITISRALHSMGIPTHAIVLVGHGPTGRAYQALLAEEQFPISILRRNGRTRSNIIIKDTGHEHETMIMEEAEGATEEDLKQVEETLAEIIRPNDAIVFAGSLPGGLKADSYAGLTDIAQEAGALVYINAGGGEPLQESLKARPRLIYLTQIQMEGLFNFPIRTDTDVIACAHQLQDMGAARVLVAMPQIDSAVLVAEEGTWLIDLSDTAEGTRTGQTEALLAGYLAGRIRQRSLEEALQLGAATAAYATSQIGHEFGSIKDVETYAEDVNVTSVDNLEQLLDEFNQRPDIGAVQPQPPSE